MRLIKKDNRLYIDNVFICDSMDPGKLPKGLYRLEINMSPRFKCELPLIYNDEITASRGFRIHQGNVMSDSNGCILVGKKEGKILINSVATLKTLMHIIKVNKITELEIL